MWEWCADWFDEKYYSKSSGINGGAEVWRRASHRGGSWLCSEDYCQGYRVAARATRPLTGAERSRFPLRSGLSVSAAITIKLVKGRPLALLLLIDFISSALEALVIVMTRPSCRY